MAQNRLGSALKAVGCIIASFSLFVCGLIGLIGTMCGVTANMKMIYLCIAVSAIAVAAFLILIIQDNRQHQQDKKKTQ